MSIKSSDRPGFADLSANKRKCKHTFFDQINKLVDWKIIQKMLDKYYPKGIFLVGIQVYDPLLLFKIFLLQTWYGLSDYQVEEEVNDRITFSKFCGISMDHIAPDHSVLSLFKTQLTKKRALGKLLDMINIQLECHGMMVRPGSSTVHVSLNAYPEEIER